MHEREADARYNRLVDDLETMLQWLDDRDESHWATWLGESRRQILAHDGNGLSHLLRAYGGMGSFNDLPMRGEIERVRSRIYDDAGSLLGDLQR
ncbi:MAG: hypothetical protein QOC92_4888 [Acidimicrobiaceae bacterium]